MKRLIQILWLPQLHLLPVMKQVFEELAAGFIDYQCRINTVTCLDELEDGGIMFLHNEDGHYKNNHTLYEQINILCPNTIYICWYWRDFTFRPFNKMIRTGENYMYLHEKQNEISDYDYMIHPEFVPLLLRASDSPDAIGNYPRTTLRDYCFMGGGYKMDWMTAVPQFTGFYHRVIWDNYLSYNERRAIYLSSTFAFGFQSDDNIRTGHLSQRIFEGLAYGCIVLCENKLAEEYTNGAVVHIVSKEDLVLKMEYYKAHPDELLKKQQQGYEWTRQYGTNRTSIQLFLHTIHSRFNDSFNTSVELVESVKPVVSVNIMGGLGNQLFQIAAAYSYAKQNNALLQILHTRNNGNRPLYWDTLLTNLKPFLVESLPSLNHWNEDLPTMYKEISSLDHNGLYLHGYLQSSKYHIKDKVKQLFKKNITEELQAKYHYLLSNKAQVVIMHSRQTDYITYSALHGPLTHKYYIDALEKMTDTVKNPFLVLCGDDNQFWKNMEIKYPHIILEENDINTFILLQQFNYFIMSNSTFIWWCAYLADTKNVIVPAKWFGPAGPCPYHDIYEDEWIRM